MYSRIGRLKVPINSRYIQYMAGIVEYWLLALLPKHAQGVFIVYDSQRSGVYINSSRMNGVCGFKIANT